MPVSGDPPWRTGSVSAASLSHQIQSQQHHHNTMWVGCFQPSWHSGLPDTRIRPSRPGGAGVLFLRRQPYTGRHGSSVQSGPVTVSNSTHSLTHSHPGILSRGKHGPGGSVGSAYWGSGSTATLGKQHVPVGTVPQATDHINSKREPNPNPTPNPGRATVSHLAVTFPANSSSSRDGHSFLIP
ncbi:hypothetical protein BO70DRAFT_42287 [Aspergillus heteromorphus CBS 117.55]|uniref:Uncharacterized protein n=1 Tax=Aspergillus heteromorphus CBS 117.55 TaxID=1448321 RepID=A0A317W5R1_9EURO|nr:uncharacterized protein BO70DRAFT_42287 [Aspergillus heteromorphus CBS 117.55]PWY81936.1 hypothetical protein BO70DRAFT_42287 [Aspergillus heteromorphus CBS 117.55]